MRIFAMFLPQFHTIKENDLWWGKGFTEWTTAKNARSYYAGHRQPVKPLHDNYYNLLDKKVVQWQTDLMKRFRIDGLVYYHYYFTGRLLLQKPAENLLNWKEIDQPFFFCWANHSWARTWNGKNDILMKQEYGDSSDWEAHFQYLLPFFKDRRYEKRNNKPLFMMFRTDFACYKAMMGYFNLRCRESGFDGIYLIETAQICKQGIRPSEEIPGVESCLHYREPDLCMRQIRQDTMYSLERLVRNVRQTLANAGYTRFLVRFDGERCYKYMRSRSYAGNEIPGVFFSWDNTPRYAVRGHVISPPCKDTFFEYMDQIRACEYVLVNAWNEWTEGMMLEPDEIHEYQWLEWIYEWRSQAYA